MNNIDSDLEFALFKQMDRQMRIDFIDKCLNEIGCVDIPEAGIALAIDRRTVYQRMKSERLSKISIGKHKFPCINN